MSRTPTYPTVIPRPFADSGNRRTIPDTSAAHGQASFAQGFPEETQLPLASGGIAPNRLDFQGLFHGITSLLFWAQSGGQWSYSASLGYTRPSVVFHNNKLWWCLAENGPESGRGAVAPGSDAAVWQELFEALASMSGRDTDSTPVGTVIMYHGVNAPDGYFPCNGGTFSVTDYPRLAALLGGSILPDLRGYFVRGYDTRNTVDPDGASRAIGGKQDFALQNIVGNVASGGGRGQFGAGTGGPFYVGDTIIRHGSGTNNQGFRDLYFDASRVVKTSTETRPANVCLLYCIKHD